MRKLFCALAGALLATTVAHAAQQAPTEISTVRFAAGQTRTLEFAEPVKDFMIEKDGIVEVVPRTDQTFTVKALAPGETLVSARGPKGELIYRMNIAVTDEGHEVRLYGTSDSKDYISRVCTDTACGRADADLAPPTSQSKTVTRFTPNEIVSKTQNYR